MALNSKSLKAIETLSKNPITLGYLVGFKKLTSLHNKWMCEMITGKSDATLQAHRGSYKTTCVSISLAIICVLFPHKHAMFMRKTDADVKEVMKQVANILQSKYMAYFVKAIYGIDLKILSATTSEIRTNLSSDIKGTPQLVGMGTGSSLTGKHFDIIFTDDIVNVQDRISKAERERTKLIYQELRNIINRGGRIFNTGTPWHKDDAFTLMPNPERYDCYNTGLITDEELQDIKSHMASSLFATNYELRHIATDDALFFEPRLNESRSLAEQGICHIDAAYGGSDYTAFTIVNKSNGNYYVYGRLWQKHVDECLDEVIRCRKSLLAGRIYCEDNGDKGYLAKELRNRGERVMSYHESMNKYLKITNYLKFAWNNVYFVEGTDSEYIEQVLDYTEDAAHDDAPDSLSCLIRLLYQRKERRQ